MFDVLLALSPFLLYFIQNYPGWYAHMHVCTHMCMLCLCIHVCEYRWTCVSVYVCPSMSYARRHIGALKKGKRWQIQLSQPPVLLARRDMKPCLLRDEPFYLPKQKMDSAFSGDWADIPSRQELPEARGWRAKVCLTFLIKSKRR